MAPRFPIRHCCLNEPWEFKNWQDREGYIRAHGVYLRGGVYLKLYGNSVNCRLCSSQFSFQIHNLEPECSIMKHMESKQVHKHENISYQRITLKMICLPHAVLKEKEERRKNKLPSYSIVANNPSFLFEARFTLSEIMLLRRR